MHPAFSTRNQRINVGSGIGLEVFIVDGPGLACGYATISESDQRLLGETFGRVYQAGYDAGKLEAPAPALVNFDGWVIDEYRSASGSRGAAGPWRGYRRSDEKHIHRDGHLESSTLGKDMKFTGYFATRADVERAIAERIGYEKGLEAGLTEAKKTISESAYRRGFADATDSAKKTIGETFGKIREAIANIA